MRTQRTTTGTGTGPARSLVAAGLVGAVGLLAGCLPGGEDSASSSTSSAPLTTSSTTAPTTSGSSSPTSGDGQAPPPPTELLGYAKSYMSVSSSVTIEGTFRTEKGEKVTYEASGATNPEGNSRTVLTVPGGGRMELVAVGWDRYLKVDEAYLKGIEDKDDNPLFDHPDEWVKLSWAGEDEKDKYEELDAFRPGAIVKGNFFGESLTDWDVVSGATTNETVGGIETTRMEASTSSGKQGGARYIWVAQGAEAKVVRLSYGDPTTPSVWDFSGWNSTSTDITPPSGAVDLKDDSDKVAVS